MNLAYTEAPKPSSYEPYGKSTCPYCGNANCEADWTDVGVGCIQTGPYHCNSCGATEIGPYDESTPSDAEQRCGWYQPGNLPPTVSSINGTYIDTGTAQRLYRAGIVDQVPFHLTITPEVLIQKLGFAVRAPS